MEDWEEDELRTFLWEEKLDYWKLYDSTNRKYFYVDEYGELATNGTSWNDDNMYWTTSGHRCIENKGTGEFSCQVWGWNNWKYSPIVVLSVSGLVLTIDDDLSLTVSDIYPGPECKWTWDDDGQLVNLATNGSVGYDPISDWYYPGQQDYVSFRTLSHTD